jgi:hypothetical protein
MNYFLNIQCHGLISVGYCSFPFFSSVGPYISSILSLTNINKGNNHLSPKINEQHKKERRKDMPWDRHKYVEVLNRLIGSPSPL